MTSRERILTTLRHQEPDRVPFDLGSTKVTGIHRIAYERLRPALGLAPREAAISDLTQQLAAVDEDLLQALRVDTRGVASGDPSGWRLCIREEGRYRTFTDAWGLPRRMPRDGWYYDLCGHPLAEATSPEEIRRYPWPDPQDPARFAGLRARAQVARDTGCAVILGGVCAGLTEMCLWLRGFERFFTDLVADRPMAEAMLDLILETKLRYWERALAEVGDLVDIAMEGDDLGMQQCLLMNPRVYREVVKPRQAQLFAHIKKQAPVFVFYHTCGSVVEILPDLIEVGVDILNPVQVSAAGMDTRRLKAEFGRDIVFWGGGVDTQRILPHGTPQDVRDEVRRRIDDLAPGGGFVFNTVHNIQADVPPENILAMWETLQEYGVGKAE
ncbi:MAG TPA: uroporphyrinogen decarboxylase family protein [Armatimonadota bacterium]|nr:uroporphyrinogen decarboxylase family protein [Armatimonadota bacterium]HOM83449.1 uroporphyrinogen decarboxylase family protein [Armatimonadota bacterium]